MSYFKGDRVYIKYDFFDVNGLATLMSDKLDDGTYVAEFDFPILAGHSCGGLTKPEQGLWVAEEDIQRLVSSRPNPMEIVNNYHETTKDKTPFDTQVGGGHYKTMAVQPIEFILANELGFCEGNIIKYTCRYKQKGGIQDLKKVIHYAEMLIADLESKQ